MLTFRRLTAVAAFAVLLTPCAALADTSTLSELGRLLPGFSASPIGPFAIADFDGDGRDDIVVTGNGGSNVLLQVVGRSASGIAVKQVIVLPESSLARVLVRVVAGVPHLLSVGADGRVREFGGWPLAELRSFNLGTSVSCAAIGDIDNDGHDELVVANGSWFSGGDLIAFDVATGMQRWVVAGAGATDILLAQLDGDPALEIIVASTPGLVIDGATQAIDWTYDDGFGAYLASGRFGSTRPEFVASRDWGSFAVFQSDPYSPLWDAKLFDIDAIATADLDGDGIDEILEGDGQWGSVNVYDSQTHSPKLTIQHSAYATAAVGAVQLDGVGPTSIAYAPRQTNFGGDELFALYDAATGTPVWTIQDLVAGPFTAVGFAPMVAGGVPRLVFGAQDRQTFSNAGSWREIDASTGQPLWQSADDDTDFPWAPVATFSLSAVSSGAPVLVLAGADRMGPGAAIVGVDPNTYEVEWRIGAQDGEPLSQRTILAMTPLPMPAGVTLGAACLSSQSGVRIFMFDGSGTPLWESVGLGNGAPCTGVVAGDFGGRQTLVAAVLSNSIRAFDASSHLLAWSLEEDADGASLAGSGDDRKLVVFQGSQLKVHDAATHTLQYTLDLHAPIQAVADPGDDLHRLIVSVGGRLALVDGVTGSIDSSSDFLGNDLAAHNQLGIQDARDGISIIGAGSSAGVFRYRLLSDALFTDGFDD